MTAQQHYVEKPGGQKTSSHPMKTERLKQIPGTGEVVKDEMIPVPGTGDTPAAEAATAKPAAPKPAPRAMRARETMLQPATARIARFSIIVDHGTTLDDLERPDFWAGLAPRLKRRPGDLQTELTVSAEDGSFWAEMVVLDVGAQWAKCRFKYPPLILDQSQSEVAFRGHTISFAVSWRVIRDADHAQLQDGFATAQAALTWLDEHLRSMAA